MSDFLTKTEYEKDAYEKRHKFVNQTFQPIINKLDDKMDTHSEQVISLWKDMEYIKKEFQEHKRDTKEGFQELKELIYWLSWTFATKEEHKQNSTKINFLYKIFWIIWGAVLLSIVWAVLNLIMK